MFAAFGPILGLYSGCAAAVILLASLIMSLVFRPKKPVRMVLDAEKLFKNSGLTYSPEGPRTQADDAHDLDNPSLKSDPGMHSSALPGIRIRNLRSKAVLYKSPRLVFRSRVQRRTANNLVGELVCGRNLARCIG